MLRSLKDLEALGVEATDGAIGHVEDVYFDDDAWVVRTLVVNAGSWLASRKVLISPMSVRYPGEAAETLALSISREQVSNSPAFDTDKPVSRQHEMQYLGYYDYPYYWGGAGMWGGGMYPFAMVPGYAAGGIDRAASDREEEAHPAAERVRHRNDDPHLRSCKAVVGYHLHATDGEIGHVAGYLIDEATWAIRYIVVDTSNWWLGHEVLIAPQWISGVHWSDETVSVDLSRESLEQAPPYDPEMPYSRESESSLHQHHGRTGYWASGPLTDFPA